MLAQLARFGDFFGIVFIGEGLIPDELAEGLGDFAGVGFVGEDVGFEAINGQVLQGFAGEGRGESLFAAMGGLFGDFGMGSGGRMVPCLIKLGIREVGSTVPEYVKVIVNIIFTDYIITYSTIANVIY